MCDSFFFFLFPSSSSKSHLNFQSDPQKPLLIINDYDPAAVAGVQLHNPTAAMSLILTSWLNGHRLRYFLLFLCSPLLIPIVCATFPFLCAAEVCFRLCRRRRSRLKSADHRRPPAEVPRRVNDVGGGKKVKSEFSLLNRYLDDQLELAFETLHECGGKLGYDYDYMQDFDANRRNILC